MKLLATWILCIPLSAGAAECRPIVVENSRLTFTVEQADAPFSGDFERFGGDVCFDAGAPVSVIFWLEPGSVHSGLPELDAMLAGPEFFDVANYPRVTFSSTSIQAGKVFGMLKMKGNQKSLALSFVSKGEGSASGKFELKRLDYDIGTGEWENTEWLSNEVEVDFELTTKY